MLCSRAELVLFSWTINQESISLCSVTCKHACLVLRPPKFMPASLPPSLIYLIESPIIFKYEFGLQASLTPHLPLCKHVYFTYHLPRVHCLVLLIITDIFQAPNLSLTFPTNFCMFVPCPILQFTIAFWPIFLPGIYADILHQHQMLGQRLFQDMGSNLPWWSEL